MSPAQRPPLLVTSSKDVSTGLWSLYEAPAYRRWLFTMTNTEAMILLGFLMVLGTFANDRAWTIMRATITRLTAPVRLEDEHDIRNSLSRSKAVFILMRRLRRKRPSTGAPQDTGLPIATRISPWYGIAAVVNRAGFIALGIFIPWLLSEGFEGAAIVRAGSKIRAISEEIVDLASRRFIPQIAKSVSESCDRCLPQTPARRETCQEIFRDLPAANGGLLSLDDALVSSPEYRFVASNAANRSMVQHWSRRMALKHIGIHGKSKMYIRHQLACAPADLDRHIVRVGEGHQINLSPTVATRPEFPFIRDATWRMPLFTSNRIGSGRTVLEPKEVILRYGNHSLADAILPGASFLQNNQSMYRLETILSGLGREFLIIHRAKGKLYLSPIDDPFFDAHDKVFLPDLLDYFSPEPHAVFVHDREATALSCVELLDVCTPLTDSEYCYMPEELIGLYSASKSMIEDYPTAIQIASTPWEHTTTLYHFLEYFPIISVWMNAQMMPVEHHGLTEPCRLNWQAEVEGHFVRSALRVREVSVLYARSLLGTEHTGWEDSVGDPPLLVYRNSDYTNINFIGFWVVVLSYVAIIISSLRISGGFTTIGAVVAQMWQSVRRVKERLVFLSTYVVCALKRWRASAPLRILAGFRLRFGRAHMRGGSHAEGQHELPRRAIVAVGEFDDEPDSPPRMAGS